MTERYKIITSEYQFIERNINCINDGYALYSDIFYI